MVYADRVVLQFFIITFTINGLHSRSQFRDKSLGILSELLGKDTKNPLIVVVNTGKDVRSYDFEIIRDDDRDVEIIPDEDRDVEKIRQDDRDFSDELKSVNALYNALIPETQQKNRYNNLRTDQLSADEVEDRIDKERMIENALRSRCQARIECEEKCSDSDEESPEEKKYCPKSCKAVFDDLIKCPPAGNKKKKEEPKKSDSCGPATGRTLPPSKC